MKREELTDWIAAALKAHGGRATIVQVCRHVWEHHEDELRGAGDLFYTWQYDIRWAATKLRHTGVMRPANVSPTGVWELSG